MEDQVKEAFELFGNSDTGGIVILKSFNDYYLGYTDNKGKRYPGYVDIVQNLQENYPLDTFVKTVLGEKAERQFISIFGGLLRILNILNAFDEFEGKALLSDRQMQDYQSRYMDLYGK